jgi:hypothetical protein
MSSVPINLDSEKMKLLLKRLEEGTLDKESARELRPLLQKEVQRLYNIGDYEQGDDLQLLADILDRYIAGIIDLIHPSPYS